MNFASVIRSARRRAGLTQDQLAQAADVRRNNVSLAEQGSGTLATLIPLMGVLDIGITGLPPGSDLGSRVRAARHKRGWSLQELSTRSGLSIPTLQGLERNKGRITSLEAAINALAPTARERQPRLPQRAEPVPGTSAPSIQKLIHGDCIEVVQAMTPGAVDLVVTSPPYNAGKEYEPTLSLAEYSGFAEQWTALIPRLLSPSGALWLNVGYMKVSEAKTLPLPYLYYGVLSGLGLHLIQEVVWHYEGGLAYSRRFSHRTERLMWWVKDPEHYVFHLDDVRDGTLNRTQDQRNSDRGKNPTDLWFFDRVVGGRGAGKEKTLHPAQMPLSMAERIIRACSNPGDVVLDPFGGSGTTAVAAYQNGRGFISVEKDARYHEAATARVAQLAQVRSSELVAQQDSPSLPKHPQTR